MRNRIILRIRVPKKQHVNRLFCSSEQRSSPTILQPLPPFLPCPGPFRNSLPRKLTRIRFTISKIGPRTSAKFPAPPLEKYKIRKSRFIILKIIYAKSSGDQGRGTCVGQFGIEK